MIDLTSLAALSLSVMGMGHSPVVLGVFKLQMFDGHVDPAARKDQVRHADVLQKSHQFELQCLYRSLRTGNPGILLIIGCILQMFKTPAIRVRSLGGTIDDRN